MTEQTFIKYNINNNIFKYNFGAPFFRIFVYVLEFSYDMHYYYYYYYYYYIK